VSWFRPRGLLDVTFEVSIVAKGLDGLVELAVGLLLLVVTPATINHFVVTIHVSGGLTGSAVRFAAAYLLAHGVVKVVLVVALLRTKLWAYPWMIAFLIVFIVYQLYRIALTPTACLIALTVLDAFVGWLTWREWRKQHLELHPA